MSLFASFKIPLAMHENIMYCQKSLRAHIKVHQLCVHQLRLTPDDRIVCRNLEDIEREIKDIGRDQKLMFDSLRASFENYLDVNDICDHVDREMGHAFVARQFQIENESVNPSGKSRMVKRRLDENQLIKKYQLPNIEIQQTTTYPEIKRFKEQCGGGNVLPSLSSKQVSLLKPRAERVVVQKSSLRERNSSSPMLTAMSIPIPLPPPPPPTNALKTEPQIPENAVVLPDLQSIELKSSIKNSRLNLLEALNKAKNASLNLQQPAKQTVQVPVAVSKAEPKKVVTRKASPILAQVLSPEGSDTNYTEPIYDPLPEELPPPEIVDQESFLRFFGLYTQAYMEELMSRPTERRRRNVMSTEKTDFHYGTLELYEKLSSKRRKPQLYSPPATRMFRKRKQYGEQTAFAQSGQSKCESSTATHMAAANDDSKRCVACKKPTGLMSCCETCGQSYHFRCHTNLGATRRQRESLCPECLGTATASWASHVRGIKLRDRLYQKRNVLNNKMKLVWGKYYSHKERIVAVKDCRKQLIEEESNVRSKMIVLNNFIQQFKAADGVKVKAKAK